jgi:hypothetical protein
MVLFCVLCHLSSCWIGKKKDAHHYPSPDQLHFQAGVNTLCSSVMIQNFHEETCFILDMKAETYYIEVGVGHPMICSHCFLHLLKTALLEIWGSAGTLSIWLCVMLSNPWKQNPRPPCCPSFCDTHRLLTNTHFCSYFLVKISELCCRL